jgi:hypothetical protein
MYIQLIKTDQYLKQIKEFISSETLKGFPCPFCRDNQVSMEKENDRGHGYPHSSLWLTDIRLSCKTCRRVENSIQISFNYTTKEIVNIYNIGTVLQLNEDLLLDISNETYTVFSRNNHYFKMSIPAIKINYSEINTLIEKIEIFSLFS